MNNISANELKTNGVSILETCLQNENEAVITVHGKPRYVVMSLETYQYLREIELKQAIEDAHADIKAGRYHQNVKKHLKQVGK